MKENLALFNIGAIKLLFCKKDIYCQCKQNLATEDLSLLSFFCAQRQTSDQMKRS